MEFTHLASHDLRGPIRQVLTWVDILQEDIKNGNEGEFFSNLDFLKITATRMRHLIESLLGFAEVETRPLTVSQFPLGRVIQDVLDELRIVIKEQDIRVTMGPLPTIECSEWHIHKMMQNLISKAIKYRSPEVPLVIEITSASRQKPDMRSDMGSGLGSNMCRVTVQDNGIGFDNRLAEFIFEPFKRAVNVSDYEGAGLGLATARKITGLHGGKITAEGRLGKGAAFTIELPLVRR